MFYTLPNETIIAIAIARDYEVAKARPFDVDVSSVSKTIMVDLTSSGICASVSFEKLKDYLIAKGELNVEAGQDFHYTALIWLRGNPEAVEDGKHYMTFYYPEEVVTNGACTLIEVPHDELAHGHAKLSVVDYK